MIQIKVYICNNQPIQTISISIGNRTLVRIAYADSAYLTIETQNAYQLLQKSIYKRLININQIELFKPGISYKIKPNKYLGAILMGANCDEVVQRMNKCEECHELLTEDEEGPLCNKCQEEYDYEGILAIDEDFTP